MSAEITDAEIDSIRLAQEEFFPQRLIIRKREYIGDDRYIPATVAEDVPGRLTPGMGRWTDAADRFQGITPFTGTLHWDQELKPGYTIVDEQSKVYEVRDVRAPGSFLTARNCLLDLVSD